MRPGRFDRLVDRPTDCRVRPSGHWPARLGDGGGDTPGVLTALSGTAAGIWVAGYLAGLTGISLLVIRRRDLI